MNGESYMSIMQRGGGIINTVHATREATPEELKCKAEWFIDVMSRMGVTTVEGKSGYGLDRDTSVHMPCLPNIRAEPTNTLTFSSMRCFL